MARFVYIGDEERADAFGHWFTRGVPVEVDDAETHACTKLRHSYLFSEVIGDVQVLEAVAQQEPKRRGRPPKAQ